MKYSIPICRICKGQINGLIKLVKKSAGGGKHFSKRGTCNHMRIGHIADLSGINFSIFKNSFCVTMRKYRNTRKKRVLRQVRHAVHTKRALAITNPGPGKNQKPPSPQSHKVKKLNVDLKIAIKGFKKGTKYRSSLWNVPQFWLNHKVLPKRAGASQLKIVRVVPNQAAPSPPRSHAP